MKALKIITAVVIFGLGIYIGMIINGEEAEKSASAIEPYEYIDGNTYWAELYDDGRVTIRTHQNYVTNDDDGNVVILTEVGR